MKVDHIFSQRRVQQMQVDEVIVRMSVVGMVTATIVREDGRCLQLSMSYDDAQALAAKLAGVSIMDAPERKMYEGFVETVNGTAKVQYLGDGRYRVADGAAVIVRHPTGRYWTVEGKPARYATRQAAVTHIMETL
ncbi:hypothetical protein y223_00024 [Bordetella phage PY223]